MTTEGSLGLELAAIQRGDDWRESGAGAGSYAQGVDWSSNGREEEVMREKGGSGPHSKI